MPEIRERCTLMLLGVGYAAPTEGNFRADQASCSRPHSILFTLLTPNTPPLCETMAVCHCLASILR
jgi:hypothetical protein